MCLPRNFFAIHKAHLVVRSERTSCQEAQHEEEGVDRGVEKDLEEVLYRDLLDQVKAILTKDAMVDVEAIVCVGNALQPELARCLYSHVEREEDTSIR